MNKPSWLSNASWNAFVNTWTRPDGRIRCAVPGCAACEADLEVDHVVSRFMGGTEAPSNLQPLCRKHNAEKGGRPDRYWDREFYFDQPLNLAVMRVYQRKFVYEAILEKAEFFAKPISAINDRLLCFVAVVGAGKTLGELCVPFAINACVRRYQRAQPRIDRMLLVTKSATLRSQIVEEFSVKAAKLGLVHRPPVVAEISDSSSLLTPSDTYEIGVMCPNMLWPHYDTSTDRLDPDLPPSWVPGIDQVARRHPLVIFDEMHYAAANISDFVKAARNTLVFGFTATPFQLNGRLLENTVKISVFSYQNAMALDGSMKYLR